MKNPILFLLLLSCMAGFAQNNKGKIDDLGRIALTTFVPDQIDGLTPAAKTNLENKISQIVNKNGLGGSAYNSRFIITANVVVLSKDITPTAPPMQAYTLDVTLYIGDGVDGTKFASHSVTLKGVGENETRAYMASLKNLDDNDPKFQSFINTGKTRIIEYYNSRCDFIIKEAQTLASQKEFDAAIYKLTSVPEVCLDCFNKSMDAVAPIFKQKIDFECNTKLNEANSIWSADQSWQGAELAGKILSTIDPDSKCFREAKEMVTRISKRVYEVDKREWNLILEKEVSLERDMINAYREVGVAFGSGQPETITYNIRGWF